MQAASQAVISNPGIGLVDEFGQLWKSVIYVNCTAKIFQNSSTNGCL